MHMYMIIVWTYQAEFIFKSWKTDSMVPFLFGCMLTALFSGSVVSLLLVKNYFKMKKQLPGEVACYFALSCASAISMFLMMTMNGYVCLSLALGVGIGQFICHPYMNHNMNRKLDKISDEPVNQSLQGKI